MADPKKRITSSGEVIDQSSSSEPELVEREGEQLVKVRKRKRRSKQKKKEVLDKNRKSLLKFVVTVASIGVVLTVGSTMSLMYVNSRSFSGKVEKTLNSELGGKSALSGLSISPFSFTASSADVQGSPDDMLSSMYLEEISGDHRLYGLFGGVWIGEEIVSKKGRASVLLNRKSRQPSGNPIVGFSYNSFRCDSFDMQVPLKRSEISLLGSEAHFYNQQLKFRGGKLKHPWLGDVTLKSMVRSNDDSNGFNWELLTQNEGNISFVGSLEGNVMAGVAQVKELELESLYPQLPSLISASINIDNAQVSGGVEDFSLKGQFVSDRFNLRPIGLLEVLAAAGVHNNRRDPNEINTVGEIELSRNSISISSLEITSSEYTIGGDIKIEGENVIAKLSITLPQTSRVSLMNDPDLVKLFKKQKDGSYRAKLSLGGTLNELVDDLQSRLHGAQFGEMDVQQRSFLEAQLKSIIGE